MDWPFVGTEALAAGAVTRHELATRYDAIYRNVYIPRGQHVTPAQRAHAAWLWSRRQATVAGVSAAAMHGAKWIDSRLPAELNQASQHKSKGIVLHNDTLSADEIAIVRGIAVTTAANCLRSRPPVRTNAGRQSCRRAVPSDGARLGRHRHADRPPSRRPGDRTTTRSGQTRR